MNKKTRNMLENRKAIVLAVGRALQGNESLSREELINKCPSVRIDGNVIERLKNAGLITSTRGRYAKITLNLTFFEITTNLDYYIGKMDRSNGYKECKERKVLTEKSDLKAAFKRAKDESQSLKEEIDFLYREIGKLETENKRLREKIAKVKEALK